MPPASKAQLVALAKDHNDTQCIKAPTAKGKAVLKKQLQKHGIAIPDGPVRGRPRETARAELTIPSFSKEQRAQALKEMATPVVKPVRSRGRRGRKNRKEKAKKK
jgi:3-hydroxyisobutyrate dehydrogenase-like beta-hydroxyacid dehydrogenase